MNNLVKLILFISVILFSVMDSPIHSLDYNHDKDFCFNLKKKIKDVLEHNDLFNYNIWGVSIYSHLASQTIYEHNKNILVRPASVLKLIASSSVLHYIGKDYKYKTNIYFSGTNLGNSVLKGDFVVKASGDPTINLNIIDEWAKQLKQQGVSKLEGNLYIDQSIFDDKLYPKGWMHDDLPYGFAAPVTAFQIHNNRIRVFMLPDETVGNPAKLIFKPNTKFLSVINNLITVKEDKDNDYNIKFGKNTNELVIKGQMAKDGDGDYDALAIKNIDEYFLFCFKEALDKIGISSELKLSKEPLKVNGRIICNYTSLPMVDILKKLNTYSDNQATEILVKLIGYKISNNGSFDSGMENIKKYLSDVGIAEDTYDIADSCGVSHYNLIKASVLQKILILLSERKDFMQIAKTLSISGKTGSLFSRYKDTDLKGFIYAKTGSMSAVDSLAGYIIADDKPIYSFVFIINNFKSKDRKHLRSLRDEVLHILKDNIYGNVDNVGIR